jgi:hypothetical protein
MADYKALYNNALMLERFMCRFVIYPNTAKNQKMLKDYWISAKLPLKI